MTGADQSVCGCVVMRRGSVDLPVIHWLYAENKNVFRLVFPSQSGTVGVGFRFGWVSCVEGERERVRQIADLRRQRMMGDIMERDRANT